MIKSDKRDCVMSKKEFDGIMNSYKENRRKKIFEIATAINVKQRTIECILI